MTYIDEDIAYLIGLTFARGKFERKNGIYRLIIRFPYKNLRAETPSGEVIDVGPSIRDIIYRKVTVRLNEVIGRVPHYVSSRTEEVIIYIIDRRDAFVRLLESTVGVNVDYRSFKVPKSIFEAPNGIAREFLRGFADVAGEIRASNYFFREECHRIYLTVLNPNWHLPVEICELCREKLNVGVQTIDWGHPNIRAPSGGPWKREHQIKIFASEFEKIGFYMDYKQKVLNEMAEIIKTGCRSTPCCSGMPEKISFKPPRTEDENDPSLPEEIRGKHYDHSVLICYDLGCKLARMQTKLM